MDRILQSVFPTQIELGSIADRMIKQGREEVVEKGVVIGEIQKLQEKIGTPRFEVKQDL